MKYCLIGERLSHSYSAEIHAKCGLTYTLREIPRDKIKNFLKEGYDGFNVTIPYKQDIIPYLDGLSDSAAAIGAVNTVVKKDGGYYGYNTDAEGMRYALKRKGIDLCGKNVMILGSGGTSRTAAALCKAENADFCVTVSRSGAVNYQNCYDFKDTEIIINATPVGMFPNAGESPVDLSRFSNLKGVFDCIYNPFKTALIMQAEKLGITCSDGLPMLVKQATEAQKIWGFNSGDNKTEETVKSLYLDKVNVVLIGMPSCGKSAVGRAVASLFGKKFIDTDAEIYNATGKTPAEIIETDGERSFRDTETEIIKKFAYLGGAVIATGGGAVLREENVSALKSNGVVFYLRRDISLLTAAGRPLSKEKGIAKLFEERKAFYERAADFTADNNDDIASCAERIARSFNNYEFNPKI